MTLLELGWRSLGHAVGHPASAWWPHPRPPAAPGVLHGASAGEVQAARALLTGLRSDRWCLTTGTAAGLRIGAAGRLPRDVPGAVQRFFDEVRPQRIVLVEGDLWPGLLREAVRREVAVGVAGARMSARAFRWWSRAPRSARRLLERVAAFAAASEGDAQRLVDLGASPGSVRPTGWLKFPDPPSAESTRALSVPRPDGRPLLLAGSVHPGEVRALVGCLDRSPTPAASFRWVVVPRHPRRADRIAQELADLPGAALQRGFGTLAAWYAHADAAFVGGGLGGRGVHNLLEPVAVGLRPLHFADRGDPGGASATLSARGLATRLDGPDRGTLDALARPDEPWERVRAELDGRAAALDHLQARGVLAPEDRA